MADGDRDRQKFKRAVHPHIAVYRTAGEQVEVYGFRVSANRAAS